MELIVDLNRVTVVLGRPEDLASTGVRVVAPTGASPTSEADVHRLGDVLVAAHVGRLVDERTAWVRRDAIVFHAEGQVDPGWQGRFEERCRQAAEAGEAQEDGSLLAQVAWPVG